MMRPTWIDEIVDEIAEHDARRPDKPSDLQRLFKEALEVLAMCEEDEPDPDYLGAAFQFVREIQSCDFGNHSDVPDDVKRLANQMADAQRYLPDYGDAMRRRMVSLAIDAVMQDRMSRGSTSS